MLPTARPQLTRIPPAEHTCVLSSPGASYAPRSESSGRSTAGREAAKMEQRTFVIVVFFVVVVATVVFVVVVIVMGRMRVQTRLEQCRQLCRLSDREK